MQKIYLITTLFAFVTVFFIPTTMLLAQSGSKPSLKSIKTGSIKGKFFEENSKINATLDITDLKSISEEADKIALIPQESKPGPYPNSKYVVLHDEIVNFFDPENQNCPLPEKIKNKLLKLRNDNTPWIPKYISEQIGTINEDVLYLPGSSLNNLLHFIILKRQKGQPIKWTLQGANTYKFFQIENFIQTTNYNSFIYNLDCSGFLNAALEGSSTVPGADINIAARAALESQSSMFIAGAVILSPIGAAYYGSDLNVNLDTLSRIQVLQSVLNIDNITDTDTLDIPLSYQVIWTSKSGKSGFNGKAQFAANAGAGFGIAQFKSSTNANGSISRTSSYDSYDTYLTSYRPIDFPTKLTIKNLKDKLKLLKG
jgi:hypothetical protein